MKFWLCALTMLMLTVNARAESVNFDVNGETISVTLPDKFCTLDSNNKVDWVLINTIRAAAKGGGSDVLTSYFDCDTLKVIREAATSNTKPREKNAVSIYGFAHLPFPSLEEIPQDQREELKTFLETAYHEDYLDFYEQSFRELSINLNQLYRGVYRDKNVIFLQIGFPLKGPRGTDISAPMLMAIFPIKNQMFAIIRMVIGKNLPQANDVSELMYKNMIKNMQPTIRSIFLANDIPYL